LGARRPSVADPRASPRQHRELTEPTTAEPAERPPWTLAEAAGVWLASVVLGQIGYLVGAAIAGDSGLSIETVAASFVGSYLVLIGGSLLVVRARNAHLTLRFRPVDVAIGLGAGGALSFVLVPVVSWPITRLFPDIDLSAEAERLTNAAPGWRLWILGALVAGVTPFAEEIFFRGLLQPVLVHRVGPTFGVGLGAVLFAAVHFQLPQLLPLVAVGVVLGYLVWRTGRLGPAIVTHAVFNGLTVVFLGISS
jgi:hypothetical protein